MLKRTMTGVAFVAVAGLAGCTAKLDPADMAKIDAAVSRAEAAANKADAAAKSAADAAARADAAAKKADAIFGKGLRK